MKKGLMLTALVVLFAVPAMAAIKNTKHNLGTTGDYTYKSSNETQICVFCHTPHNATQNIPLWNRSNPAGPFSQYTASPTLNISNAGKGAIGTKSISRFCLSCHDGVTGLAAGVVNQPNGAITMDASGANIKGKANLGTDLTNDHPVNFNYATVAGIDGTIRAQATAEANGARFFKDMDAKDGSGNNMLECGSCHDVHGTAGIRKFLRRSNDSSGLCLACHAK